jgi:hypothetical protein
MKNLILFSVLLITAFSVKSQSLNAYMQIFHGANCNNQGGKLAVQATGGTGSYTYLWSNGSTLDTAYNLGAGTYWVTVYSGADSIVKYHTLAPWGIDSVHIYNACNGALGSLYLDNINAQYPLQYFWYNNTGLISQSSATLSNLTAGNYSYKIIDAEGCTDSAQVEIVASDPILHVFVSDSTLCYGQSAQLWYTPGFTLYDNWGMTYNSSSDTLTVQNYMNSMSIPNSGVDIYGCEASLANNAFAYLQPHPDPVPLYQFGDTISVTYIINTNPSATYTYSWSTGLTPISTGPYSYLQIDSSGQYSVSILNEWGCTNFGSIQAYITNLTENKSVNKVIIANNPNSGNLPWEIELVNSNKNIDYKLYDLQGKLILSDQSSNAKFSIAPPENAGVYILEVDGEKFKLIKK